MALLGPSFSSLWHNRQYFLASHRYRDVGTQSMPKPLFTGTLSRLSGTGAYPATDHRVRHGRLPRDGSPKTDTSVSG